MRRRLMALKKSGVSVGLPDGYTAVNYIQSSGTQWIEMGVAPSQNTKVVLKIKINSLTNQGASLIGSRTDLNSTDQFTTYLDNYGGSRFLFRVDGQTSTTSFSGVKTNTFYTVTLSASEMRFELEDGTIAFSSTFSVSDFTSTVTMALFKSKGVSGGGFQGKIYGCKHYNGDKLIQDFVPCLDTEGVPCMFDFVSRKPFYNVGTGSFTWG